MVKDINCEGLCSTNLTTPRFKSNLPAAHAKCLGAGKAGKAERDAKHAVKPWPGSHRGWGPVTRDVQ